MKNTDTLDAVRFCEDILREELKYNTEHKILPSVNVVIDRMLDRGVELRDVYRELCVELHEVPLGVSTFLDSVLDVAAFLHPDAISEQRASRERLVEINNLIGKKAKELGDLIQRRSEISNRSGFSTDCHYHIGNVIEEAAGPGHPFNSWLKEPMKQLRGQFGLKYWPKIEDIVRILATDALRARVEASDTVTGAATTAMRSSKSDFVRALYVALTDRSERNHDQLPKEFKLSDGSMASLVNCLLDLGPDKIVDDKYIKGFRQNERKKEGQANSVKLVTGFEIG